MRGSYSEEERVAEIAEMNVEETVTDTKDMKDILNARTEKS